MRVHGPDEMYPVCPRPFRESSINQVTTACRKTTTRSWQAHSVALSKANLSSRLQGSETPRKLHAAIAESYMLTLG